MGPYDNETGAYILTDDVMKAHWLVHEGTSDLYIVPKSDCTSDGYGNDEEVLEDLYALDDADLMNDEKLAELGFSRVPETLRRFDDDFGYFVA